MPTQYNLKTTARPSTAHGALNFENLASTGTAAAASDSASVAKDTTFIRFMYTTAYGVPNNADWPNGTYKAVLDVSAAGAALTYGLKTINAVAGHFGRVADTNATDGIGESDAETVEQAEAAFTGTGIKTATVSWNPAAGATTDVYEGAICVQNSDTMDTMFLTFDVNDGSSYLEFPDAGIDVTPGVASLTLAAQTPTVTASANIQVTPGTASLTATLQTPTAQVDTSVTPGVAALTTTLFTPTVAVSNNQNVTPGTASLTLAAQTPTVAVSDNQNVTPGTASLTATAQTPTVAVSGNVEVTPGTPSLTTALQTPTVAVSDNQNITPGVASLVTALQTPTVAATANQNVTPGVASLIIGLYASTVAVSNNQNVTPGVVALSTVLFTPTVSVSSEELATGRALIGLF